MSTQPPWGGPPGGRPEQQRTWRGDAAWSSYGWNASQADNSGRVPAPSWNPQQWPAPPSAHRPPQHRGLVVALILLSVAAVTAVAIAAALLGGAGIGGPVPADPSTARTPADRPVGVSASPSPVGPSPVGPSPSGSESTPGADPDPRTAEDLLVRNAFYDQVLSSADCSQQARPLPDDRAGYERYLGTLIGCTGDTFGPLVSRSGATLDRPALLIYTGTVATPCGQSPVGYAVFYCPGNETIYATVNALNGYGDGLRLAGYYIVFHEYAHHLQGELGILQAAYVRDEPQAQLSRRIELQADCWMGMTTRAMQPARLDDTDRAEMRRWREAAADDIHGSTAAQLRWVFRGFDTAPADSFAGCSTWQAAPSQVR